MSVWEYKVITSGKGGFATPALLETFLNQLGKDEWEIIHYHSVPDNALAFTGLARRSTQRDWTLEDAVATAAKAEADKLRAEFEAKFKGAAGSASGQEEKPEAAREKGDDGLRRIRDTDRDMDPDAEEEEAEPDEWEKLAKEDELPSFFEAIQPLMRRNQRGAGLSAGVDHLAKKWGMSEDEVMGALKECGFSIPGDENAKPEYVEYDGDLFWVNVNRRGEYWINTKEKPRAVFRVVTGTKIAPEEGAPDAAPEAIAEAPKAAPMEEHRPAEQEGRKDRNSGHQANQKQGSALPEGPVLLDRIRPFMRRNRSGPGGSGSVGFLSRALRCKETDLTSAFAALGMIVPAAPGEKHEPVEITGTLWWLERDPRGAIWINGREAKGEAGQKEQTAAPATTETVASTSEASGREAEPVSPVSTTAPSTDSILAGVRLLLKGTRTGAVAAEVGRLAESLGKSPDDFLSVLTGAGFKIPEKAREKPVFVEHAGEIFWLNKNAKNQLWLNAKASKFSSNDEASAEGGEGESKKPRRPKGVKASADEPSA